MANSKLPHAHLALLISTLVVAGCGVVEPTMSDEPDAAPCDPLARFDPPRPLLDAADNAGAADAALSADELTLYMTKTSPAGDRDIYVASRSRITDRFGAPVPLATVDSASEDAVATLGSAGLALLFQSNRIAGEGRHLYVATRASPLADFSAPALLAGVRSPDPADDDMEPFLTADGQELWFISTRTGNQDVFRAAKTGGGFAGAVLVPELSSPATEQHVTLSADRLTAYVSSTRTGPGAAGGFDIYRARRGTVDAAFSPPIPVPELNTASDEAPRWLSADNCRLYMHAKVGGTLNLLVATRQPSP